MDSSNPDREAGYATAAAAMIALALSIIVAAVVATSLSEMRGARNAFDRRRIEHELGGAHAAGVVAVVTAGEARRFRWTEVTSLGPVEVLAEPESVKLSVEALKAMDDADLERLGVVDTVRFRGRLTAAIASGAGALDLLTLDSSPLWRQCGGTIASPYGSAATAMPGPASEPGPGRLHWRPGELWRFRVSSRLGWVEDRIVRFTGQRSHPAAVVERSIFRGRIEGEPCAALIE